MGKEIDEQMRNQCIAKKKKMTFNGFQGTDLVIDKINHCYTASATFCEKKNSKNPTTKLPTCDIVEMDGIYNYMQQYHVSIQDYYGMCFVIFLIKYM